MNCAAVISGIMGTSAGFRVARAFHWSEGPPGFRWRANGAKNQRQKREQIEGEREVLGWFSFFCWQLAVYIQSSHRSGCAIGAAFWGQEYMSLSFLLPEVLQELRWWGGSSSCPWGAIGLALVCVAIGSWICGFVFAALIFSPQCRRLLAHLARVIAINLQPPVPVQVDLSRRLAEYNRSQ